MLGATTLEAAVLDFVDFAVVRLADPTARAGVFDQEVLAQIAAAGYGQDALTLDGPYSAVFDELSVGVSLARRTAVDGTYGAITDPARHELHFWLAGNGPGTTVRIDALWRGAVVARRLPADARIVSAEAAWPDASGIDAAIVAALGALPSDPAALEHERRTRFLARLRALMHAPDTLTDARFDALLASADVLSVTELFDRFRGQELLGALQIKFNPPDVERASTPRPLPVTAAIFVRDQPVHVSELIADSKQVRAALVELGVERARDATTDRAPVLVLWIVPETLFDDNDWPGATDGSAADKRLQRRRAAAAWLAPEGIAVAVMPKHP